MTKIKPTVSVVMPTYNRAHLLGKAIKSILNQTYQDFELIIVDDGSTDKTSEVVKSFKDKRIRYFRQTKTFPIKSQGAAAARNMGIKKAKGKFIAFNDDDDFWRKRKLEKQVSAFKRTDKKTGVVYIRVVRHKGKEKFFLPYEEVAKKEGNIHRNLFLEDWVVMTSSALVKRECFQKVGLFDERLPRYQDLELWLRISQDYYFKYLPEVLVDSFILSQGIGADNRALVKATELIFQKYRQEIESDKEILASWHFRFGDLYYHQQKMKKARNLFLQALKNKPSFKYFRAIVKTFLGRKISETLISWQIGQVKNWPLLAILILALFLRLINLNQSLWLDEAVQAITSRGSFFGIFQELRGDFHPPLYHLLMWVWVHLFGSSETILRLPSVIFGVTTVYVVYLIASMLTSEEGSPANARGGTSEVVLPLLAALFLATAPFHIYYSQEARNYALTTLLATLSMYFFVKLLTSEMSNHSRSVKLSTSGVVLYVFSTTLLLYTNYFGLFILLAQALVSLEQRKWRFLKLMFICLILFVPNLFLLKTQLLTGSQATASLPEWGRIVNLSFLKALPLTFIKFSIGRITIFNKKIYAVVAGFLFVVYGGIFARGVFQKRKLTINHLQLTIILWLVTPILCAWLLSLFIPNYQPFRLLLVLPAFYLLLAYGIFQIKITMIRIIVVAFVLFVNLVSLGIYYTNPYFHRENWRGLVQFIESQENMEIVPLLPSYNSYWPYEYYSSGKTKFISVSSGIKVITQEDINNLTIEQFNNKTIYYIRYLVPMFDPQEKTVFWLNQNGFVKIREVSFNQVPVWEYQRCR